jgi:hypothetical protein
MYTTREIEAGSAEAENAVAALNQELASGDAGQALIDNLRGAHLSVPSLNFRTVPADAPELHEALEAFEHEIARHEAELPNAWGAIIITQNQDNLKRIDVVIVYDNMTVEEGGEIALTQSGEAEALPSVNVTSEHIFIHEDAQYFAAPGA